MKRIFYTATAFFLLFWVSSGLWAECRIDNISLERDSTFTKLTIYADIPFEYEHFTVEPKNDKPYRIVVDIADAIHHLPQNNFWDIPSGTITAIRTSQFRVEPSKIVRIVMDIKDPIVYKTEKQRENQLSLVLSTPQDSDFPFWAVNMTPFKEKEVKLAQVAQTEKELPKEKVEPKEQAKPVEKEVKPTETKQAPQVKEEKVKEEKPIKKEIAKEIKKEKVKAPSKPEIVEQKKAPEIKKIKEMGEVETEVEPEEPSAPETSKVAQLKEKVERKAKTIKRQAEKIKPRGKVIEVVYKRKVVTYQSNGRRDPFSPVGEQISIEFGQIPLPAYESLKLVGILKDASGNIALLEDGEGYGYIMREGDKVKDGEVIYVGDNRVLFQITEYGWSKTVVIELSKGK